MNLIRLLGFAACVLAGAFAIRFCEGNRRGRRPLAVSITIIYLMALLYYTLFSRTEIAEMAGIGAHSASSPAAGEERPLLYRVLTGIFAMHIYDFRTAFLFNILLFLPLGYLLRYAFPGWKLRQCIFAGALGSLLIETLQGLTGMGMFDVRAIAANTIGVILGVLLLMLLSRNRKGRDHGETKEESI